MFAYAIIPVMILMHSIVGWDFAMTIQSGWHSTVFGPYFVAGAILSGAATVVIALVIVRKPLGLEYYLRDEHFDGLGKFILVLSLAWGYLYFNDFLVPWYGQKPIEKSLIALLTSGQEAPLWWLMIIGNFVVPLATLGFRRVRTSKPALLVIAVLINLCMWLERYIIVAVTLERNELPFSWGQYIPQFPELLITVGAFCLLAVFFMGFIKLFPVIPIWEVQEEQAGEKMSQIGQAVVPMRIESD